MFFFGVVFLVGLVFLVVGPTTFLATVNLVVGPGGQKGLNALITLSFCVLPLAGPGGTNG